MNEEEFRRLSRPVIALIAPESYLGAIDSPLVLPPEDLIRLFADHASANDSEPPLTDEERLRWLIKRVGEQKPARPHEPTPFK
jgi:hypothetical protein